MIQSPQTIRTCELEALAKQYSKPANTVEAFLRYAAKAELALREVGASIDLGRSPAAIRFDKHHPRDYNEEIKKCISSFSTLRQPD